MRKLASVQYVHHIEPIEGADKIELVKVLGWQCVAPKGQFKEGDLCVYFEVDSFLPICDKFEFLRKSSYKKNEIMGEGFRLKTIKLRGQLSQGLVQPLDILEEKEYAIGDDVTEQLGVRKWEEEEKVSDFGIIDGQFPKYFQKTDEIRVQSKPEVIAEFWGKEVYISTKMDGTSVSVYHVKDYANDHFGVCGRNYEYSEGPVMDYITNVLGLNKETVPEGWMIQGEFCGAGIQKNRLKLIKPKWFVFTIQTPQGRLGLADMLKFCEEHDLDHVPIEEVTTFFYDSVEPILERAKGNYPSGYPKEGIVIRTVEPIRSHVLQDWLSIKAINNDYLLKNG